MEFKKVEELSPDKIQELRGLIDKRLQNREIYVEVRKLVQDYLTEIDSKGEKSERSEAPDYVLQVFRERGIIENLINSLTPKVHPSLSHKSSPTVNSVLKEHPHGIFLHLKLQGGKAFFDSSPPLSHYIVAVQYRNNRFRSRPVPAISEPKFDDDFLLLLRENDRDITKLVQDSEKVHIVVLRSLLEGGYEFIGGQLLEWRKVLKTGLLGFSVEVGGGGCPFPRGVLELRCELIPRPNVSLREEESDEEESGEEESGEEKKKSSKPGKKKKAVSTKHIIVLEKHLETQFQLERAQKVQYQREFYIYAQGWYKEYLQTRPLILRKRLVKIFAENEFGESVPVVSYLSPIQLGRTIDSPSQAARYVSLFPLAEHSGPKHSEGGSNISVGSKKEIWWTCNTILSRKSGSVEDHAMLLCNFLLGFGMDAWVGVGGKVKKEIEVKEESDKPTEILVPSVYVLVRRNSHLVVVHDPVAGKKYRYREGSNGDGKCSPGFPYRTLDCVFNDTVFYANLQRRNDYPAVSCQFENPGFWKGMSPMKLGLIRKVNSSEISVIPPGIDPISFSIQLEKELRRLISMYRSRLGFNKTVWDNQLSYILSSALYAYEEERKNGVSSKTALIDFQNCVKRAVSEGYTFRGFPMFFSSDSASQIFEILRTKKSCISVLETSGDDVKFGLRVKIFPQPEDIFALWVFVCSTCRVLN